MDKLFIAANSTHHSSSLLDVSQGGAEIMNLTLGSVGVGLVCLIALILIQVGIELFKILPEAGAKIASYTLSGIHLLAVAIGAWIVLNYSPSLPKLGAFAVLFTGALSSLILQYCLGYFMNSRFNKNLSEVAFAANVDGRDGADART